MIKIAYIGVLAGLWMLLSGHTEWYMLALGTISVAAVFFLAERMRLVDAEGFPAFLFVRIPAYWTWLMGQIIQSNIAVARLIFHPTLNIDPSFIRVKASQESDLGKVCYANSITLTPGTVATAIEGEEIQVHALTEGSARDLEAGAMDRRVEKLESGV